MPQGRSQKKVRDAAEASIRSPGGTKTAKALKPEAKIAKKSPNPNFLSGAQEPKVSREVQGKPENASKEDKNKEKNATDKKESEKAQVKNQINENHKEKVGGMIFMCNGRTKPDCFRYMVMGLPQSKKDTVTNIKPGLKLFLYDFDAKLLHGIYKASSAGGMKLEPAAFNGSYPSQVRFKVHMDCLPLPEAVFKREIMGSSAGKKLMFDTELTVQQVKKLTDLFRPSPQLQSNANTLARTMPVPFPVALPQPIIPAVEDPLLPHSEILARSLNESRLKEIAPTQRDAVPRDPLSLTEKEYRIYGLKREHPKPVPAPVGAPSVIDPTHGSRDPYYTYRTAPEQHALPPRRAAYLAEVDSQTDSSRRKIDEAEHLLRPVAEHLPTQPTYNLNHSYGIPRRHEIEYGVREVEAERLHSTHAANSLSDYNRRHQQPGGRDDFGSLPVSSRYAFAGPELLYR